RAGDPGEDDQRIARQLEVEVLQVVLARAADDQRAGRRLGCERLGARPCCSLRPVTPARAPLLLRHSTATRTIPSTTSTSYVSSGSSAGPRIRSGHHDRWPGCRPSRGSPPTC